MKKAGWCCLNQLVKINMISYETEWICAHPDRMQRTCHFVAVLPRISRPSPGSNEDTPDKLRLRVILQNNMSVIFKIQGKSRKMQKSRDLLIQCRLWSCPGSFCCWGHRWDNRWDSSGVCGLDGSGTSVNFLALMVLLWLERSISLFARITHPSKGSREEVSCQSLLKDSSRKNALWTWSYFRFFKIAKQMFCQA